MGVDPVGSESAGVNNTMLIEIALLARLFLDETPGAPELQAFCLSPSAYC